MELVPEVSADGGAWKILGILSKSRKECSIAQIGGMYQGITTVGIDDDSSPEVKKFIVNHSEISSLLVSAESAKEFCEVKKGDDAGLMAKLTNLIIIETSPPKIVVALALPPRLKGAGPLAKVSKELIQPKNLSLNFRTKPHALFFYLGG